jgi:hypothetical protein
MFILFAIVNKLLLLLLLLYFLFGKNFISTVCMLNLSALTSEIRTVAVFVIIEL